jgi:hypothetical protein
MLETQVVFVVDATLNFPKKMDIFEKFILPIAK